MTDEVLNLTFTNASPIMVLLPVDAEAAPAEFAQVIVGAEGSLGSVEDLEGFTTPPTAYYILAST